MSCFDYKKIESIDDDILADFKQLEYLVKMYESKISVKSTKKSYLIIIDTIDRKINEPVLNCINNKSLRDKILTDLCIYHHSEFFSIKRDLLFAQKYPDIYLPYIIKFYKDTYEKYKHNEDRFIRRIVIDIVVITQKFKDYLLDNNIITYIEYNGYYNMPIYFRNVCIHKIDKNIKITNIGIDIGYLNYNKLIDDVSMNKYDDYDLDKYFYI